MTIALSVIAVLMLSAVVILRKFMTDMAKVEKDLLGELKEMKAYLKKMSEK